MFARPRLSLAPVGCLGKLQSTSIPVPELLRVRPYATQSTLGGNPTSSPRRKQVTIASDDGRVGWSELSTREKAARTTQQSFNFLVVVAGMIMTGGVGYFLYLEVFSTDSKTSHFNRAVSRITSDHRSLELLGDRKSIKAYGEPTWNKWTRNRHLASRQIKDRIGTDHFYMHFNAEGSLNKGVVNIHMTKRPDEKEWRYELLALDVPGHQRLYLENASPAKNQKTSGKMFGVRWW